MYRSLFFALLLLFLLNGCGGTEFQYQSGTEEKPGPGLFSGEAGVINLIGKEKKAAVMKTTESEIDE